MRRSSEPGISKRDAKYASDGTLIPATDKKNGKDSVVIHVRDDANNVSKDFHCSRQKLLHHMKYFESYLADDSDDIDISVHCDINIFDWLVKYVHDTSKSQSLTVGTVVSIIVSSEFLRISELVNTCLNYMKEHLNEVLRLPIDLHCLSSDLVRRLAKKLTDSEIENLRDKKNKLKEQLYEHKTHLLIRESILSRCTLCRKVFHQVNKAAPCEKAATFLDYEGNVIAHHVADKTWDTALCAQHMNKVDNIPYRSLYWRFWGCANSMHCSTCNRLFFVCDFHKCRYHPMEPDPSASIYPCCNRMVIRFDQAASRASCCEKRNHAVEKDGDVYKKLILFERDVCAPISPEDFPPFQGTDEDEERTQPADDAQRVVPEQLKKMLGEASKAADNNAFFDMALSSALRRDVLREEDRRRMAELLKYRDQTLNAARDNDSPCLRTVLQRKKLKTTGRPQSGTFPRKRSL